MKPTRWEYCTIGLLTLTQKGLTANAPTLCYMAQDGAHVTPLDKDGGSIAATIAKMGTDGWEMVGTASAAGGWHALYFKRPLP